jgi:hypothetical protein
MYQVGRTRSKQASKYIQNSGRETSRERPYDRPFRRLENIKIKIKEMRCDGEDWIQLAQYSTQSRTLREHENEFTGPLKVRSFLTT